MTLARDMADFAISSDENLSNRNMLYNGAMQVAQRGTSTAGITASGYNTADRWNVNMSSLGTWTQSVEADAPTGSGFRRSLKMLCTTTDASPAAGDFLLIEQILEGQDLQRIAKGTASALDLTISFWVKANVTGTYVLFLQDTDNNRSVSKTYTIDSSATWEKKTISFPSDATGAFDNDNNGSLQIRFILGAGTNWTSGARNETWAALTLANLGAGQTANLAAATNNYWQVTGVQLEVGPAATPFEFKSFGQELAECQRYYQIVGGFVGTAISTTSAVANQILPVTMRSAPSGVTAPAALAITDFYSTDHTQSSANVSFAGSGSRSTATAVQLLMANFTGLTNGRAVGHLLNSTAGTIAVSAEL